MCRILNGYTWSVLGSFPEIVHTYYVQDLSNENPLDI